MLILTRKLGESIIIDDNVQISVIEINKNNIKIGVNAPRDLPIYREEVYLKIKEENAQASSSGIIDFEISLVQHLKFKNIPSFNSFSNTVTPYWFCKYSYGL